MSSSDRTTTNETPATRHIVRHRKCGDWGRGLLLWERDGKRGYQFEDGRVRVFAEDFFHLLETIGDPDATVSHALVGLAKHANSTKADVRKAAELGIAFEDQVQHFLELYPDGFGGDAWQEQHRGRGSRRALKRHRDASIAAAAELWEPEALRACLAEGRYAEVRDRVADVLDRTDLVPRGKITELRRVRVDQHLGEAIVELLVHPTFDALRFDSFRRMLGAAGMKEPGWALASAIVGLAHPQEQTCVRTSVFDVQASVLGLSGGSASRPTAAAYQRYLGVAQSVWNRLRDCGRAPRDLLDVYDFIWTTLRPGERDKLGEIRKARGSSTSH